MAEEEKIFKAGVGIDIKMAEELGFEISGNVVESPADQEKQLQATTDSLVAKIAQGVEANIQEALKGAATPQAGQIVTAGYEYWDLLNISPIQSLGLPPWRPQKIIKGGGPFPTYHYAVLFINPLNAPGPTPSATIALGSRGLRVRFELSDLTNWVKAPSAQWLGTLPGPAPAIIIFRWPTIHPNPGSNPKLMELSVTADITDPGQPYAVFASQWWELEGDPGWPVPRVAGIRNPSPMRFLVYPE